MVADPAVFRQFSDFHHMSGLVHMYMGSVLFWGGGGPGAWSQQKTGWVMNALLTGMYIF